MLLQHRSFDDQPVASQWIWIALSKSEGENDRRLVLVR